MLTIITEAEKNTNGQPPSLHFQIMIHKDKKLGFQFIFILQFHIITSRGQY